ncbi:hypothetical protein [Bifidobacterium biavatii]|uniref:Tail fiber protein n=1 Tax=Bifidobacterium biavatii DSM 23969 TaxID=1437608 RepID=A0A086ZT87_9BIFI|nr:hypothetical protein [Bifidobacterium biavatii]KFI49737.1 tail fiber protein [Bifidobacterium biavatii DSM 23969]
MARYEIEKYRTIEATLDLANDYAPPIRLNAGDLDGRILKFNITDGGNDVDDLNGLSARLTWNRDPTNPNSGGGFTDMTKTAGTDNPAGVYRVSFTAPVPRSLLQDAGERTVLGIDIEDADGGIISSRNIPVMVEPARVNPKAPEIADPLKDLHDTIDEAKQMIAEASIDIGTVTTLTPAKNATSALTGIGLKRQLNLGIPRGSKISSVTATALDAATPTVNTSTDANGDTIIALGLPRGKQGEKGDKGDPGDAGGIATADKAGIVKPGDDFNVWADGTLSLKESGRFYSRKGYYEEPFEVASVLLYPGRGIHYDVMVTLFPNELYSSFSISEVTVQVLPDEYVFGSSSSLRSSCPMVQCLASPSESGASSIWTVPKITSVRDSGTVTIAFTDPASPTMLKPFNLCSATNRNNQILSPPFSFMLTGVDRKST